MSTLSKRRRSVLGLALVAAVSALGLSTAVPIAAEEAAPAVTESAPVVLTASDASSKKSGLTPPPVPTTADGTRMQGGWYGPFSYRNLHTGKCLDGGANTNDGAGVIQWPCIAGRTTQDWWVWETYGDGMASWQFMYNAFSGKCLETWSGHQNGVQLVQGHCNYDYTEHWFQHHGSGGGYWLYSNEFSGLCAEVWNWQPNDWTSIVQWDCHGGANQRWGTIQPD